MEIKRIHKVLLAISLLLFLCILLDIVYLLQVSNNKKQAEHTASVLIHQIETIMDRNKDKEGKLTNSLKEDYVVRAKCISYILDRTPEIAEDLAELNKIACFTRVDEIHIFDEAGTIQGGTVPRYYGYSLDSGEQMAYFKPMLDNKDLVMCQGLTPNTAEGKLMMYAICWNEQGTGMLQVGIEPERLMEELKVNDISEVIRDLAVHNGVSVVVADQATNEIVGATRQELKGKLLGDIGMAVSDDCRDQLCTLEGLVNGHKAYYTVHAHDGYLVTVIHEKDVLNREIPSILRIVTIYILVISAIFSCIILLLIRSSKKAQKKASYDLMTGLLNRSAYETRLKNYSKNRVDKSFVYVSIDINNLKHTNDTLGHAAGDELIKAIALCMQDSFGSYGELFRTGGDEFAAMIYADRQQFEQIKADFEKRAKNWHGRFIQGVSMAYGYVRAEEFPEKELSEIVEIADKRMYVTKWNYYASAGRKR